MKGAWLVLGAGLAGCGAPQATPGRMGTPDVLFLEATVAYAGAPVTLTVTGASPGQPLLVAGSDRKGRGPCPPELPGTCAGIRQPRAVASFRAGADGSAVRRVEVPRDVAGTVYLQAVTLDPGLPGTSQVLEVFVVDYGEDTDGDGVIDADEVRAGLDPARADTDGDGLSDGAELRDHQTDPLDPDSDDDGALDSTELRRGLDPWDADQDSDGILDGDDLDPRLPGPASSWTPVDRLATDPAASVPDPEFDAYAGRATWQPLDGAELWVADIDPTTGAFVPSDGRGVLVDTEVGPVSAGLNGPEWMIDAHGAQVVYIVRDAGEWVLWRAREVGGVWAPEPMPGARTVGVTPYGSRDPTDPRGRVTFTRNHRLGPPTSGWREVEDGATVTVLAPELWSLDSRWVDYPGRTLVGTSDVFGGGWRQAWLLDIDTDTLSQVTWDASHKYDPFVTRAPSLGGDRVMAVARGAQVDRYEQIAVLRETAAGWVEVAAFTTPGRFPWVVSPEVFLWEGRAYVSWLASDGPRNVDNGTSSVWVASLDPAEGLLRRVDGGPLSVRKDPEPYIGGDRPFVYYTEVLPDGRRVVHVCEFLP